MEKILLLTLPNRNHLFAKKDSCVHIHNYGIGNLNQGLFTKF